MNIVEKIIKDFDNNVRVQYESELREKYELLSGNHCHIVQQIVCFDCNELIDDCTCIDKVLIKENQSL